MDGWIIEQIRWRSRHRVVAWALVAAAVVLPLGALALDNVRYMSNSLLGPFDLGAAELAAIGDVSTTPRYFVRVTGPGIEDTGLVETATSRGRRGRTRSTTWAYYSLELGGRTLIYKAEPWPRTAFVGTLHPLSEIEARLSATPQQRANAGRYYPFYVREDVTFRWSGFAVIGVLVLLGGCLWWGMRPAWRHMRDPATHPVAQRVAAWGDLVAVSSAVRREFNDPPYRASDGWAVTDQFLVQHTFFIIDVLRLSDVLWAFGRRTPASRYNWSWVTGRYQAVLVGREGEVVLPGTKKKTDGILSFVAQRVPWAIHGAEAWKATGEDAFARLCAAVERRKLQGQQVPDSSLSLTVVEAGW